MSVQQNIRSIRKAKGVTEIAVARHLGMSPMSYHRLETINKTIYPNRISQIAEYLGVEEGTFFNDKLTENVINSRYLSKEVSE